MVKKNFVKAEQFTRKHKRMVMIDNTVMRDHVALINIDTPILVRRSGSYVFGRCHL